MNRIIKMIEEKETLRQIAREEMQNAPSMRNYGNSPKLCKVGDLIYSYNTCVAVFVYVETKSNYVIVVPKYYSATTTRHINKIAYEYNIEVIKLYWGDNMKDAIFLKELDRHILEERIEEEKTYLTLLKYLRQKPNNKNTDSAIKQIEKALLKLDFYWGDNMNMKEIQKAWNKYIIAMQEAREKRFEKRLRRAKRF